MKAENNLNKGDSSAMSRLLTLFLSITLAHWKTLTMKIVQLGEIHGVPMNVT